MMATCRKHGDTLIPAAVGSLIVNALICPTCDRIHDERRERMMKDEPTRQEFEANLER